MLLCPGSFLLVKEVPCWSHVLYSLGFSLHHTPPMSSVTSVSDGWEGPLSCSSARAFVLCESTAFGELGRVPVVCPSQLVAVIPTYVGVKLYKEFFWGPLGSSVN